LHEPIIHYVEDETLILRKVIMKRPMQLWVLTWQALVYSAALA
jgi:hypothetical protein